MDKSELVKSLEIELLTREVRENPRRIAELLHDQFEEFGKSGKTYDKRCIVEELPTVEYLEIQISKIETTEHSENVIMLKYQSTMSGLKANRTSIWVSVNRKWQMIHHQGTSCE